MPTTTRKNALRLRDVSGPEIGPRVPNCSAPPPFIWPTNTRCVFVANAQKLGMAGEADKRDWIGRTEMGGVDVVVVVVKLTNSNSLTNSAARAWRNRRGSAPANG
jgi:hypothetical protein